MDDVHCPTGCSLILRRPRCSGVHPLDVSIRSQLVLLVLVTQLCFRYKQFETLGLHWHRCHHKCSRHCNRQSVFCCTPSNMQCVSFVKMVTGKPVNRFPTSNRFSERISGYWIGYWIIARRSDTTQATPMAEFDRYLGACECIPTLRCRECCGPPFSRNSSVVGSFWTSVLATGRLSTSAVHICCSNTWTVLYFWMEICNQVGLLADFVRQR